MKSSPCALKKLADAELLLEQDISPEAILQVQVRLIQDRLSVRS